MIIFRILRIIWDEILKWILLGALIQILFSILGTNSPLDIDDFLED